MFKKYRIFCCLSPLLIFNPSTLIAAEDPADDETEEVFVISNRLPTA